MLEYAKLADFEKKSDLTITGNHRLDFNTQ